MPIFARSVVFSNNLKGMLWMASFAVMVSGMHICIRVVSVEIHPYEIAFFRIFFALFVIVPWLIRQGVKPLKTTRFNLLFVRGVINTASMLAFFLGLSMTPVAEVAALSFAAPIYATLIAIFLFRERVGMFRWIAIFVGFAGVLVIVRPGFENLGFGQILILGSAFGWGICIVMVKELGKTESAVTITAYMSIIMAPLILPIAAYHWIWPNPNQLGWLLFLGVLGGLGQFAMSEALKLADTHVVTPVDYLRLIVVSILGYFVFGEVPDRYIWIGGTMILGAVSFIAYREHVTRK
ncbi:MAG: Riboflavin transporter [Alphaproteobacteria bacterium MarineAlpha3_Bin5]|nr:MAG: Riboflavin transporter [Alphaproteobacteria bacterium MarineAlpha3_Bin5]